SDSSNIIHYIHTGIETTTANRFHVKVIPNPFTAKTNIKYYLTEASQVSLIIMDITGKEIQKTVCEKQAKGEQNIMFTAEGYPSGLYFYKLTINDSSTVGKLLLNN
ncbi:MAG: T9SS type A sorting domain-containing protein, partial [Bacteroidales bacterium]